MCGGNAITPVDLPPQIRDYSPEAEARCTTTLPEAGLDLEGHIASIEIELIKQALRKGHYSQKRAAQLLGLSARSLRYRLQKYQLDV